jgi:hypothetical protein
MDSDISQGCYSMKEWIRMHGVDVNDEKQAWKWLAERIEWGGIEATRMAQVFYRLTREHEVYRDIV